MMPVNAISGYVFLMQYISSGYKNENSRLKRKKNKRHYGTNMIANYLVTYIFLVHLKIDLGFKMHCSFYCYYLLFFTRRLNKGFRT